MEIAKVGFADALAHEHQEQYHRDGFVNVSAVFSAGRWQNHVETGECRFNCFDPVITLSPSMERLTRDSRIIGVVSAKDKLIFKPPNAVAYGLHQDYISWKSFPEAFVTVIVAIDRATASNRAMEVFPGYHTLGCLSARDGMLP
jgi:hypothetical protein